MKTFNKDRMTIIYGTLRECVNEYWKRIEDRPKVNYAAEVVENEESAEKAYGFASGWFGFTDVSDKFDSDTNVLLFGHWGGGGIECMEITGDEEEKEILMQKIGASTDSCGYGVLEPDDITVFELVW